MSQGAALMSLSLRTLKDRLHTDVFVFINAELLPHICLDAGVISALLFVQYFFRREYFYCFTSCKWCVSYQWKHIGHLLFPVLNDILVVFFRKGAFWYTYMTDNFSYCPLWFTLLFFFCFWQQEVETEQYYNFFLPELKEQGYDGFFSPKSRARTMSEVDRKHVDGCAIFYKTEKYVATIQFCNCGLLSLSRTLNYLFHMLQLNIHITKSGESLLWVDVYGWMEKFFLLLGIQLTASLP